MTSFESISLLLTIVLGLVLIATAWWIAGIHTLLERLAIGLEARHLERGTERAAEKRMREARQKSHILWLTETASTLTKLYGVVEKLGSQQDTSSAPPTASPQSLAPPPTVRERQPHDAPSPYEESTRKPSRDSDADTLCWEGPDSGRTLLGVGTTELGEPKHGAARAGELAQEQRKSGR